MFEEIKRESSLIRILVILAITALGIYLFGIAWQILNLFSDIIVILIFAWLLSFILEPLVEKISYYGRLPKVLSALIAYLTFGAIFAAAIFLFIPVVNSQIQTLAKTISAQFGSSPQIINRFGDTLISTLNSSLSLIPSALQFLFSMLIILILSFYFIVDKEKIDQEIFSLVPEKWHEKLRFIQNVVEKSFASFLRVQLIFGIISAVVTWLVLRIMNVGFPELAALLAGIFAFIPLVGPILALIPPTFVAFLIDPVRALVIFIILLIAQQFIFNVLGPKLFSKAFKINPIIILLSFLVGAKIAGSIGAIFAIPVLGILIVVIKELLHYFLKPKKK